MLKTKRPQCATLPFLCSLSGVLREATEAWSPRGEYSDTGVPPMSSSQT